MERYEELVQNIEHATSTFHNLTERSHLLQVKHQDPFVYALLFRSFLNFLGADNMSTNNHTKIHYSHQDRQWDCRFNIPNADYLEQFLRACDAFCEQR